MMIGAHVRGDDPIAEALARDADVVQTFLGDPQSWAKPLPHPHAASIIASSVPLYVHAPYPINVGSPNNRIRIPSRKTIAQSAAAAQELGAVALTLRGGHIGDDEAPEVGYERWRKALRAVETELPILIENTAGGGNAIARSIDSYGPLWDEVGDMGVGVCLDTCHAWAAGEDLETIVDRLVAATGRIDLVHCNDSRDPRNSRRDRHTNLGGGQIPEKLLVGVVKAAAAPTVVETPGGVTEQAADITWLRERT